VVDFPGAAETTIAAISGNRIMGTLYDYPNPGSPEHAFLYDGSAFTKLDPPSGTWATNVGGFALGLSGEHALVDYSDPGYNPCDFLYDGATWTKVGPPGVTVVPGAISGDVIVGTYYDTRSHGFMLSIPEPTTFALVSVAALVSGATFLRRRSVSLARAN
jgi:hypothetical protein